MNATMLLAREEWRFWLRSNLALATALLFLLLLLTTVALTALRITEERHTREHHQEEAETTFIAQPDRHPHRMVHYGHYVFRSPSPLAAFDPGLDSVTGQSIFLEGHRQNSAMFAASTASADLGGFAWLTPALVYQLFAPLLIILLGHGAVVRERESSTLATLLAQGVGGVRIVAGKSSALMMAVQVMLLPLLASAVIAAASGEPLSAGMMMYLIYLLYLSVWGAMTLLVSILAKKRATALAVLTALWLAFTLLMPSLAVSNTARTLPIAGQIETDLRMLEDLRKLGDGHNAADPAFDRLRRDLLAQYDVETIEELPVNLRGVVAEYSEAELTETLNAYAEQRMGAEQQQAELLSLHGWLTPLLATADASRAVAATDLSNHHRFLREAEAIRFEFVQGLNRAHAEKLDYQADVNRGTDEASSRRARISAENWAVLNEFRFTPDSVSTRVANAAPALSALVFWFLALAFWTFLAGRRIAV
ncbi:MAG: DUF3526 domain-containing protein [Pseudomonadota bacterium]